MNSKNNKPNLSILFLVLILIFLGVSPVSEPHIIGKVNWVIGGANGMKSIDWFDFFLHGGSLVIAFFLIIKIIVSFLRK